MRHFLFAPAAIFVLAACNNSPQVHEKNASVRQVANAVRTSGVADEIYPRAGEWKVSGTLEEISGPSLPPDAQAEMKRVMSQQGNSTYQYCLTSEQAKRPGGKFFSRQADRNCRYDHFNMGGGKVDAVMRCGAPAGSVKMRIAGTYSTDSYSSEVIIDTEGGREGTMTMKMRSEAHRIGECTAEDEARAREDSGTKG